MSPDMFSWQHLFLSASDGTDFVSGSYRPGLVLLSVLVPVCLSMMALHVAHIARHLPAGRTRNLTIGMGTLALGGGIWVMHFIGMLAFVLPTTVHYAPGLTLLSLLPGLLGSLLALRTLILHRLSPVRLLLGGLWVGAGIGAMHYSGMAAMVTPLEMRFVPGWFLASIGVAVVLAVLALWIRFYLRTVIPRRWPRLLIGGTVMGVAIAGMHYMGMAAVRYLGTPGVVDPEVQHSNTYAALALASLAITVGALVTAVNGLLRARAVQRKLEDSRSRLRAIIDTAPDGIITINECGLIQEFSPAAERLFGYAAAEVCGHNVSRLMPEPFRSRHDGYLEAYCRTGQAHVMGPGVDTTGRRKDGREIPLRVAVGEVRQAQGGTLFVGLVADISERRELEASLVREAERAQQAAQAKSRFLANTSHEIRTPMNSIIGFTDLLLQGQPDATQREQLQSIRQSSRTLLTLINDILDTTRMEQGRMELEHIDFSLKTLALQVESALRPLADGQGLQLHTDYPDDLGAYFKGDPMRLLQVLNNLVGNAIKFTRKGRVEVAFGRVDEQVHISVRDTGIGMSEAQVRSVFDPFTQADASISRRFGGTGLGTTIARQLVELMHGRIEVESTLGVGTCFHLYLPLAPGVAPTPTASAAAVPLPPLRVLIADDVPLNRDLLRRVLERAGHTVSEAADGQQALDHYQSQGPFDLILMDVHMPHLDGLQATGRIRAHEREHGLAATPVIALTASVMASDRTEAEAAGMDGFAVKPLDVDQLFVEMVRVRGRQPTAAAAPEEAAAAVVVDWRRGTALWGERAVLCRRISEFLARVEAEQWLPAAGATADVADLRTRLHTLRGAAGNLALTTVAAQAGQLEGQLDEDMDVTALAQSLAPLRAALAAVSAHVAASAASAEASEPATATTGTGTGTGTAEAGAGPDAALDADLSADLRALAGFLRGHELDDALLARVLQGLRASPMPARATALASALEAFAFERAGTLITTWLDAAASMPAVMETER